MRTGKFLPGLLSVEILVKQCFIFVVAVTVNDGFYGL